MKHLFFQSQIEQFIKQRNGYLVLASGLCLLTLLMTCLCFSLSHRERIILVPPTIKQSFWVGYKNVSDEYLAEMTTFFAYLRLNVTLESADNQRQLLLRYVDPNYFGTLNTVLVAERDRLSNQHVSTAFYPVTIKTNTQDCSAIIVGDLVSHVGADQLTTTRMTYQIRYRYDMGRLLVTAFQEVKSHD